MKSSGRNVSAREREQKKRYILHTIQEQEVTQLCLFIMKKMLIKTLVRPERAVSKIKYLFCHIMRDMKQYFAKAEEIFQHLLAGFVPISF